MVLKKLTKQLVNFTNDNDFFEVKRPLRATKIKTWLKPRKSSLEPDASGRQDERPHFFRATPTSRITTAGAKRKAEDHPSINLGLVAPYNLPLQKAIKAWGGVQSSWDCLGGGDGDRTSLSWPLVPLDELFSRERTGT